MGEKVSEERPLEIHTKGRLEGLNGRWMSSYNTLVFWFFCFFLICWTVQYPLLSPLDLSVRTTLYHILENTVLDCGIKIIYYCFLKLYFILNFRHPSWAEILQTFVGNYLNSWHHSRFKENKIIYFPCSFGSMPLNTT